MPASERSSEGLAGTSFRCQFMHSIGQGVSTISRPAIISQRTWPSAYWSTFSVTA